MTTVMIVLLNSSKTMRSHSDHPVPTRRPPLEAEARELNQLLRTKTPAELQKLMHISPTLAAKTHQLIENWQSPGTIAALDGFVGDIYKGLKAEDFTEPERKFADHHLRILSGQYGIVSPLDLVSPYRLEAMYILKGKGFKNLYDFWQDKVAKTLPSQGAIVNVASVEYAKLVTPFVDPLRVISPLFLTIAKGKEPTFVAIHAKWARGAFARWIVKQGLTSPNRLNEFNDMDYAFDAELSTPQQPTYIKTLG